MTSRNSVKGFELTTLNRRGESTQPMNYQDYRDFPKFVNVSSDT